MIEKCKLDAINILFNELRDRIINIGEKVRIDLFKSGNFIIFAIVNIKSTRIEVNIFVSNYINFPSESGLISVSKFSYDEIFTSDEYLPKANYEINTIEYSNSNLAICVSLSAELIFSTYISGYEKIKATSLIPIFRSYTVNRPIYASRLIGGITKMTKENINSVNIALEKILSKVIDFNIVYER